MKTKTEKKIYRFYFALAIIACASFVFTNISYDAEYQLAMAYRMIKGDELITQMWEPHQTSAFLCAILMKLYMVITGTTTGIVLYIQMMGLLIRGGISIFLYKTMCAFTEEKPAQVAAVLYLLLSPKDLLVPEFSNMQLWFGTLMLLMLMQYLQQRRKFFLVLSAINLCLGIFSYPSFALSYIAVCMILIRYCERWKKDIRLFTGICAAIGGSFAIYLLVHIGPDMLISCLSSALALEPSHTVSLAAKAGSHLLDILRVLAFLALIAGLGLLTEGLICRIGGNKEEGKKSFMAESGILISWYLLMAVFLINILSVKNRSGYSIPLLAIMLLGIWKRRELADREKCLYDSALYIGITHLAATMLLSDHPFLPAVPYMLITVCVSVMPLYRWFQRLGENSSIRRRFLWGMHLFLILVLFKSIYIHTPISGRSQICSLSDDMALIRSGPAMGIITDEAGAAKQRDSMKEWKQYIHEGDTIWILGEPVDTLGYLYEDVSVGAPTVMSTPTYNSKLLRYWEINPGKYPDVVILASGFGELQWDLSINTWLISWLEKEYCAETIIDGNYWRYYFKK